MADMKGSFESYLNGHFMNSKKKVITASSPGETQNSNDKAKKTKNKTKL